MADETTHRIGIDLGGTKTLTVLFDKSWKPVASVKQKTRADRGSAFLLDELAEAVNQVLKEADVKRSRVSGIGVGCPGIIDAKRGVVLTSPNIGFLKQFPLAKELNKKTDLPVALHNDVKMGLYGEFRRGAAKGFRHVVGVFIGTGIGGGLILNGELYVGAGGAAGEVGHIQVDPLGSQCGCGRTGCFETLASRLAIASEAAVLASKQKAPSLLRNTGTDLSDIKSGALAKAIRSGDAAIKELVRRRAQLVGRVCADLVNIFNPEAVVLGGGLVEALETLFVKEVDATIREHSMKPMTRDLRVVAARLGDYAVATGAACYAAEQIPPES